MNCLDCKWAKFRYIPPDSFTAGYFGDDEPDLVEFECLNPNVKAFDFDEESELEEIAENCEYFQDNDERIASAVCEFATNHERIVKTGEIIIKEYKAGNYTENSLKMAFGMIAQSAINEFANEFMDSEWCTEALADKEFVGKISAKLREHFLGGENGQTAAI